MGIDSLTQEERSDAFSLASTVIGQYFSKIDDILVEAMKEAEPAVKSEIQNILKGVRGTSLAFNALFAYADDKLWSDVQRSESWILVRSSIRGLAGLGTGYAVGAGAAIVLAGATGGVAVAGAAVVFGSAVFASMVVDAGMKSVLDAIEADLPVSFTGITANPFDAVRRYVGDESGSVIQMADGGAVAFGKGGNDVITGGNGADLIQGGAGDDILSGGGGDDTLWGGEGNDLLWGEEGDDFLIGGEGNDTLVGGAGSDEIWGDEGDDTINGGNGAGNGDDHDTIYGGAGNDRITVEKGHHEVYGEAGDDQIVGEDASGIFDGGEGNDRIDVESSDASGGAEIHGGGGDDILNLGKAVFFADGGDGNDQIKVVTDDGTGRTILGGAGNDQIIGGQEGDFLFGDEGNDQISGGAGADTLDGGAGNDEIFDGNDGEADQLQGGSGFDTYHVSDRDTISDSDGKGSVTFSGLQLQGGKAEGGGNKDGGDNKVVDGTVYTGSSGETYTLSGSVLTVSKDGETITIQNWKQGQLGIRLSNENGDPPDNYASPLVLDLDGDGIETTALETNSVYFDIDADGIRERTAWVNPDDGLLALDRNGDGTINDVGELFGTGWTYSGGGWGRVTGPHGLEIRYDSGFDRLAELDDNHDGVVDAQDAAYAQLRVWRDLNSNGQSEDGELISLAESGVAGISVHAAAVDQTLNGNLLTDVSSFTTSQGTQGTVGDIWFKFDQCDTSWDRPVDLDPEIQALPDLMGTGALKDLHSAMAEDGLLKDLVASLAELGAADLDKASALVESIILRWCRVPADNGTALDRGNFANGAHVAVIEAFTDTPFLQGGALREPRPMAGAELEEQWDRLFRDIAARLLVQSRAGAELFPEIRLVGGDFLSFAAPPNSDAMLARLRANAPTSLLEKLPYWHAALRVLDTVYGSFADTDELSYRVKVEAILKDEGLGLDYYSLLTARIGGSLDDGIVTQSVGGSIYESDPLAERCASVVLGGAGDDEIHVGGGKQIVYFGKGQGNDLINTFAFDDKKDAWTFDGRIEIRLAGLSLSDVSFSSTPTGTGMVVTILETMETLTLMNIDPTSDFRLGRFIFDDGSAVSFSEAISADQLRGGAGADIIAQNDGGVLDGAAGDDLLLGDERASVYVFGRGYGHDLVADQGVANVVRLGPGIGLNDLSFYVIPSDLTTLRVAITGTDDVLSIRNQFGTEPVVGLFEFSDGGSSFVPPTDFHAQLLREMHILRGDDGDNVLQPQHAIDYSIYGNGGNDTLVGSQQLDTLAGGAGDDVILGGEGTDVILYAKGDGQDVIQNDSGAYAADRLILKDINPDEVTVSIGANGQDVVLNMPDGGSVSLAAQQNSRGWSILQEIEFADGTVWHPADLTTRLLPEVAVTTVLTGTARADRITGTSADERIDGGTGNDTLSGGGGSDVYVFGKGSGNDTIDERGSADCLSVDRVRFTGLTVDDLLFSRDSDGRLKATIAETGETLNIEGQFNGAASAIEFFLFEDGTVLDIDEVFSRAVVRGTSASEYVYGTSLVDTLDGGAGNDTLSGNGGSDTYLWRAGAGSDTIDDQCSRGAGENVLRLDGLSLADLSFARNTSNGDLLITILSTGESLRIRSQFTFDWWQDYGVATVVLADGTTLDRAQISALVPISGTDGDDTLIGTWGDEGFLGGRGDDTLIGGGGSDTYIWRPGDGNDHIRPGYGGDTLRLENVARDGVTFARKSGESDTLLITVVATGEVIAVENQFSPYDEGLDRIIFGDGSEMSLDGFGSDLLCQGDAAADYIYGDGFANTLAGGAGDDTLMGGQGADFYLWRPGDGNDTIKDGTERDYGYGEGAPPPGDGWIDPDTLRLSDVTRDDLAFSRDGSNFVVRVKSSGEDITIENYYTDNTYQVERIVLDDGQTIDLAPIALSLGLAATAGDDTLIGGSSDDTLDGGAGNDILMGGLGDDSYVVGHNSDDETVYEAGGSADAIRFADGIVSDIVSFRRDGDDLIAEIDGVTRGAVTIKGQFASDAASRVEQFRFEDGTVITWLEVEAYLLDQASTNHNDTILGYAGNDVINARGGDDTITGGGGDDIIYGGAGRDTVVFSGRRNEYTIGTVNGHRVVTDIYSGRNGTDILIDVETLQFAPDWGSTTAVSVSLAANTAPVASEAAFAGREDHVLKLQASDLLAHASDPDGDSLRLVSVGGAVDGTVTLKDGVVTFTPAVNFAGEASFSYTVVDSAGAAATAVAKIVVAAVNDAPVSTALPDMTSGEDSPFRYTLPDGAFADVDGDVLTLAATLADGTALPAWLSFDAVTGTFSGTPPQDFNGSLSVRVTASDGSASVEQGFDLAITTVNDAPMVTGVQVDASVRAGDGLFHALPSDLFTDVDGDVLSYSVTLSDGSPLPSWLIFDADTGSLYGVPSDDDVGSLSLRVTASDGSGSAATDFALTIEPGNAAPVVAVALADVSSAEDGAIAVTIPAGTFADVDGDALTLTATQADGAALPAWLAFDPATGTFSGQPPADFNGALAVTVTASDGQYVAASSFTLTITPVNDAPVVAAPPSAEIDEDAGPIAIDLLTGASDADGDTMSVASVVQAGGRSVAFTVDNGTLTLAPGQLNDLAEGQSEQLVFTYAVTDGTAVTAQAVTITVTGANDGPTAAEDSVAALSGRQLAIATADLLANDSDPDHGAVLRVVAVDSARNGTVELKNGVVVFTSAAGFSGTTTFEYVVADEFNAIARGQVTVEVTPADMVFIATQAPENFVGGPGTNTVSYQNSTCAVWADLSLGRGKTSYAYGDTYNNIQNLIGSRYGDILVGDAQNNTLIGGGGGDLLSGGAGQDTVSYADSDGGVTVNLALHFGQRHDAQNDTLCDIEDVIGSSFDDTLTGDCGSNSLYGGAGDDTLDGGGGNDLLIGGAGDDTYMVGSAGDQVVEQELDGGTDTVVSTISYALLSGLENLTLAGCGAINGSGNGVANILMGNSARNTLIGGAGDDTLDGGGGNDTLVGGIGSDTYVVEGSGDMVIEQAGEGTDTVQASLSYALGNNVENLTLTGCANLTGTGNALDNVILGNGGRNTLTGGGGDDTLDGGGGNDTLVGGTGSDVYAFARGSGQDLVRENDATVGNCDVIRFDTGIAIDQLWFGKSGNNLVVSIIGTSDKVTVENWYGGSAYHVERFETADGHVLADAQVSNLVSAMAGLSAPKAGQTVLPRALENTLEPVIAANWH